MSDAPTPRKAGRAALIVASLVVLIVVAIFVGLNLQGAKELRDEQAGQPRPDTAPKTENDLSAPPRR